MDISQPIEDAIARYLNQWMEHHPYWAWIFMHPLPSLGLFLLIFFLFWGLIRAVSRGTEQIWLFLLKTPFKILQPLFQMGWKFTQRVFTRERTGDRQPAIQIASISTHRRITAILDRLHALKQEQEMLLEELTNLLKSQRD